MKVAAKEGRRVLKHLKRRPEDLDPERHTRDELTPSGLRKSYKPLYAQY